MEGGGREGGSGGQATEAASLGGAAGQERQPIRAIRAVLWDLDGTLLDSSLSIRECMNRVLAERGFPVFSKAELEGLIGNPLRFILAKKCPDPQQVEAMAHRYREVYGETGWVTVRLYEGLERLVEELRADGLLQGIVTSKGQREAEVLLADLGISHLFDAVIGDDDARPLKPDPAPVLAACASLGVEPAEAVMVGDTEFDVRSAQGAGARCVGVLWGIRDRAALRAAGADRLAAGTTELRRLLAGLRKA